MRHHHQGGDTTARLLFSTAREARIAVEMRRLRRAVLDYTDSRHDIASLGEDHLVEHLASAAGFHDNDLAISRVMTEVALFTVVGVPTRIWHNPEEMRALYALKTEAKALRTRCLLVPQRWLYAAGRYASARALARCRNIPFSPSEKMSILAHLESRGSAAIGDCAEIVGHHADPYGVVLALASRGHLDFDRHTKLGRDTIVWPVDALPARKGVRQ